MIQRIQSIFLLLVAIASGLFFAFPIASVSSPVSASTLFNDAVYDVQDNPILMVMFGLAGALALYNIFQFRNRSRQLIINRILSIIMLLGVGLAVFLFFQDRQNLGESTEIADGAAIYLPIIGFVFVFLASRFIKKDDSLVKSMDRLR